MWASMDGPMYYCAGFMALQPSPLSIDLLENWKASLVTPYINQVKLNSLVQKSAIRHKQLPQKEFPDGSMYFDRKMRRNVVVVHNNYIVGHENKVQRFKNVGLWWNNGGPLQTNSRKKNKNIKTLSEQNTPMIHWAL